MTDWKSRYRLISTGYIRLGLRTNPLSPDDDWASGAASDERGGFRQSQWLSGERVMDILSKSSSCLRRSFLYSSISNVRREDNISGNRLKQMSADECGGFEKKASRFHPGCLVTCRILYFTNYKQKPLFRSHRLKIKSLFRPLILHIFKRYNKHKCNSTNSCSSVTNICSGGVLKFVFSL